MRRTSSGIISGIYDPRLRNKAYPPSDPSLDGHFGGASQSVVREAVTLFASGTGDRNVVFWKSPSDGVYIIEGGVIELIANVNQAGTPVDMEVMLEVERVPGSGFYMTLAYGLLEATQFAANVLDIDLAPVVFGHGGLVAAGYSVNPSLYTDSFLKRDDGRLLVTVSSPSGTLSTGFVRHGLQNDARVRLVPGAVSPAALPAAFSESVLYYVVNRSDQTFGVALTSGGAAVGVASAGTNPIHAIPISRGVAYSRNGIYVGKMATDFRGSLFRLRARTISGTNAWDLSAAVSIQLRMVR